MSDLVPVWIPETDPDWRAYAEPAEFCRCRFTMPNRKACGRPGVADIRRGQTQRWSYCWDHLYGRIWREGRLWKTVLRPSTDLTLLSLAAALAADLIEMDADTAISLDSWPHAAALVEHAKRGAQ